MSVTIVFILIFLVIASHNIQKSLAVFSASMYVKSKYEDRKFQYENAEFVPQFGDYFVTFKDKNGNKFSLTMTPKFFPVFVLHDPLDQPF